jgi:inorganic pyrophosphatase
MEVQVIIDTPKGSAGKFSYDEDFGLFKLKKILPAGMVFPFDFGFIPGTKGQDGDPLDMIVISELRSFPGCMLDCNVIGVITAMQTEKNKKMRNDRFIGVPAASHFFEKFNSMNKLPEGMIRELETFFITYNKLEGKIFSPMKRLKAAEAGKLIRLAMEK